MRGTVLALSLLLTLAAQVSCGHALPDHVALQPGAEAVEIATDPPSANNFKMVGQVEGLAAAADTDAAERAAKNDLRNKAAALGASLVTIDEDTCEAIPLDDKSKVKVVGRAYKSIE
jgi:hypothetical protein